MAPRKNVDVELLKKIAAGIVVYISKEDGMPLLKQEMISVDTTDLNEKGDARVALTEKGKGMISGNGVSAATTAATAYGVIKGAVLPPSKRGNAKGGGAPTQYPFDQLEIGDTFFVPKSDKHPNPEKTLGSTVSSANMRYAEKTGEIKTVTRNKRGAKNKLIKDADGNPIQETVQLPVYRFTRRFSLRPVEAGKTYGNWVAPADGVLIARVNLKED